MEPTSLLGTCQNGAVIQLEPTLNYIGMHYVVQMQYCRKRARQSIPAQQTNARRQCRVPT